MTEYPDNVRTCFIVRVRVGTASFIWYHPQTVQEVRVVVQL
jgi:hypothetical protein